jgi:hypothetical protein
LIFGLVGREFIAGIKRLPGVALLGVFLVLLDLLTFTFVSSKEDLFRCLPALLTVPA